MEDSRLVLIEDCRPDRRWFVVAGCAVGIAIGVFNIYLDVEYGSWLLLPVYLLGALAVVIVLHEGLHGLTAYLLGHRPVFGIKPPLVFTTFRHKLPRGHMILTALTPLVVIDAAAVGIYLGTDLKLFANLCFTVNTIGAVGDVWIAVKLFMQRRGTLVQDTMSGMEIWGKADGP